MASTSKTCPDQEVLRQLLLGRISGKTSEQLEEHLLHCDACGALADSISASDEITAAIQHPDALHGDEELLHEAIQQAKQLRLQTETVETQETMVLQDEVTVPTPDEQFDFLAPAEEPGELGRLGEYRVLEVLGVGGMGVVFRAEDPKLKRQVALKAVKPAMATKKSSKDRFLREAQATAAIEHHHIVQIYQVGEDSGVAFIAMQFLKGESLQSRLERVGKLEQQEVVRIAREVAEGLAAAHEHGLIHRDIKPDNIWMDQKTGWAKILDFGLARTHNEDTDLTQAGMVVGTPKYMAPEQAKGEVVDHRCDLFSLGSVMYHLISGRAPFGGGNLTATLIAVSQADCQPIAEVCPHIDTDLANVVDQLLSKQREQRPQSAAEVVAQLASIENKLNNECAIREGEAKQQQFAETAVLAKPSEETSERRSPVPVLVACALAAITLTILAWLYFAGIVLKVGTDDGMILVEIDEKGKPFKISVNKDKSIEIKDPNDGQAIRVSVDRQKQQLKLEKQGFEIALADFSLESPDGRRVKISFVPLEVGVAAGGAKPPVGSASDNGWQGWPVDAPAPAVVPFDSKQATDHQKTWAEYLGVPVEREFDLGDDVKLAMVLIPPGEFLMGSSERDRKRFLESAKESNRVSASERIPSEGPQHRVLITTPFWMSRSEITVAHYRQFVNETNYETDAEKNGEGGSGILDGEWKYDPRFTWNRGPGFEQTDSHPVVNVSWNDASEFCKWLEVHEGALRFELPTEAQWEYACRAGTTEAWHFGNRDTDLKRYGWYLSNSKGKTHPVCQLNPNPFGLYDMHGNVWEWCSDKFAADYYANSPGRNPIGADGGKERVQRGGAFHRPAANCRSAFRYMNPPHNRAHSIGFRVTARVLTGKQKPPQAIAPFTAKEAQQHQENWAKFLGVPVSYENSIGMKFQLIPPGEFLMGSTRDEIAKFLANSQRSDPKWIDNIRSEAPRHRVRLTKPFFLGTHEVSFGEYAQLVPSVKVDDTPDSRRAPNLPVGGSWYEAVAYCNLLSQQDRLDACYLIDGEDVRLLDKRNGYRLPTEAEWEFSCRAGTMTPFYFGTDPAALSDHAWSSENREWKKSPVGKLRPNGFGLHDMLGNSWEWCEDWYDRGFYSVSDGKVAQNPIALIPTRTKIMRGGSVGFDASHHRSSYRGRREPSYAHNKPRLEHGFRIAISVDAAKSTLETSQASGKTNRKARAVFPSTD